MWVIKKNLFQFPGKMSGDGDEFISTTRIVAGSLGVRNLAWRKIPRKKKEVGFGSIWDRTLLFSLAVSSQFSDPRGTLVK